jgi:hypothetical protein
MHTILCAQAVRRARQWCLNLSVCRPTQLTVILHTVCMSYSAPGWSETHCQHTSAPCHVCMGSAATRAAAPRRDTTSALGWTIFVRITLSRPEWRSSRDKNCTQSPVSSHMHGIHGCGGKHAGCITPHTHTGARRLDRVATDCNRRTPMHQRHACERGMHTPWRACLCAQWVAMPVPPCNTYRCRPAHAAACHAIMHCAAAQGLAARAMRTSARSAYS